MGNKIKGSTTGQLVQIIIDKCLRYGQKNTAVELGISASYLNDIINFKRDLSRAVAFKLGYLPQLTWEKMQPRDENKKAPGGSA